MYKIIVHKVVQKLGKKIIAKNNKIKKRGAKAPFFYIKTLTKVAIDIPAIIQP